MKHYRNDPYLLQVRFNSTCATCGCRLPKGADAYYWPSNRKVYCPKCGENDYQVFLSAAQDEDFYNSQY